MKIKMASLLVMCAVVSMGVMATSFALNLSPNQSNPLVSSSGNLKNSATWWAPSQDEHPLADAEYYCPKTDSFRYTPDPQKKGVGTMTARGFNLNNTAFYSTDDSCPGSTATKIVREPAPDQQYHLFLLTDNCFRGGFYGGIQNGVQVFCNYQYTDSSGKKAEVELQNSY